MINWQIALDTRASRLLWLPPQITRGRVRQAVSQAADWLHHAARGVVWYWLVWLVARVQGWALTRNTADFAVTS